MVEVHIGAGAVIDLATADDLAKDRKTLLDAIAGGKEAQPLRFTQMGQRLGQSSEPIDLGSPPIGRMWFLVAITVTGKDPWESLGGGALCALCVGDYTAFHLGHVRIPAITIPQCRATASDGIWVYPNESVYMLTFSLGATQQISVNLQVEEWRQSDICMSNPGQSPLYA